MQCKVIFSPINLLKDRVVEWDKLPRNNQQQSEQKLLSSPSPSPKPKNQSREKDKGIAPVLTLSTIFPILDHHYNHHPPITFHKLSTPSLVVFNVCQFQWWCNIEGIYDHEPSGALLPTFLKSRPPLWCDQRSIAVLQISRPHFIGIFSPLSFPLPEKRLRVMLDWVLHQNSH